MKIKIIKRAEREKVLVPDSETSQELKDVDTGKKITATVKSWIDELKLKSESDAAIFRKLFNPENFS